MLAGLLLAATPGVAGGFSLRFFGHGVTAPDLDGVEIRIDDSASRKIGGLHRRV
jgi:hypothetical protein